MERLNEIVSKFASSGWELIDIPARKFQKALEDLR
jgi:glutathione peroxidase-family protein